MQGFTPLRSGILTKEMEKAVVGHLNEKEFLSEWGVYSLSIQDPGYDINDVDWGGPGIYTGAGPELVSDLLNSSFFDEGIDLLNRILWWGELPYLPQAMRANIKGYRENGRANLISGVCASQFTVYGLFRIKISPESIRIQPIEHDFMKGVSLKRLKVRGKIIDIEVSEDNEIYTVTIDGKQDKLLSNEACVIEFDDKNK